MWWGSGGGGEDEEEDLPDLKEQFEAQENLLGQLKGALKSNEAKLQNKEKQVKALASRLSKSKLEERAKEAAAKQTERQLLAESTGTLPKATITSEIPPSDGTGTTSKRASKLSRLRQELQDARAKEAEMLAGQQSLEDKVAALQRELAERDNIIADYDLTSVTGDSVIGSPGTSSPYVMSPERGGSPSSNSPQLGSSFEDVFNVSGKSALIVDLNEKILDYERRILDLEEDLRVKDEVIRARTEAVSAVSEQMSHKGRSVLEELEETKEEMKKMLIKFSESESEMKKKSMSLQVDHDAMAQKLKAALESESRAEEIRFDLSTKNAGLQEKIVKLQSELSVKRASDSERELELVELRAELESSKARLSSKEKDTQKRLDTFYNKISSILEENEDVDQTLSATLKDLQSQLIDLEEEKGHLQLRLIDYEDEKGTDLKAALQKLKESLRSKDEELVELRTTVEEAKNEIQEISEQLQKKEKDLSSYVEQVTELIQSNEEVSRSKVAAEMRALELEEVKESLEAENKDLSDKIEKMTQELKEPFEKLKVELAGTQDTLHSLERTHSECKSRALQNDRELLGKAEQIKEHQIEISSLEKVLQAKSLEISDELTRSDLLEKELKRVKDALAEANAEVARKDEEILTFKSSNLQEQISTMDEQIISLNIDVAEKQEKISALESDYHDLQSKLQEKEKEAGSLEQKYDGLIEENNELLKAKEDLLQKLKDLEEEKSTLSSGLDSNKLKYVSEVNELSTRIQELTSEKEGMSTRLSIVEEELNKSREEGEKEVESLNETLNEKNKTIKSLKEESESFKMEVELLHEKNIQLSSEVEKQTAEIGGLHSQLKEQEFSMSEMILEVNSNNDQQKELKGLNHDYESQVHNLKHKVKELEAQNLISIEEVRTLKEAKQQMEESVNGLSSELESYRSTLSETQKEKSKLENELKAWSETGQKDDVIRNLEGSIEDLKSYKDSIKIELSDKVSEIKGLKDIITELQTMMSDLKADIVTKTSRIQCLEEELSRGENTEHLTHRISELEAQVSVQGEMNPKINQLETELSSKNGEIRELFSLNKNLEEELLTLREAKETVDSSSEAKLSALQSSLDEKIKENASLQDKLDSLNVKLNSLEENYNRLLQGREEGNLIGERDKLKVKNDQLLDKARKLLHKCKQQEKIIKEKDEEFKSSKDMEKSEKEEMALSLNALRESNLELQTKYEDALKKLDELSQERECLRTQVKEASEESTILTNVGDLNKQLLQAHKQVESLNLQNSELKETIKDLNNKLEKEIEELRSSQKPEHKNVPTIVTKEEEDGWDDGFPLDEALEEEVLVKEAPLEAKAGVQEKKQVWKDESWGAWGEEEEAAESSSKPEKDPWNDEGWGAWGGEEEVVESSKLEKDSKETEKIVVSSNDVSTSSGMDLIKEYELKISELSKELSLEKEKFEIERSKFSEEEEAFYDRIDSLEKDVSLKNASLKALQSSLDNLMSECKAYEAKTMELKTQMSDSTKYAEQLAEKSEEIKKLINENKEKSERIKSLEDELSSLSNLNETIESQMSALNDILSSSLAEKEALGVKNSTLETRLLDMDKIEAEMEVKSQALSESKAQLEAESSRTHSLGLEVDTLREGSIFLTSEVEVLKKNLAESSATEARIRSELEHLQVSYDNLCSANMANENEHIQQLQVELERLRSDSLSVEVLKSELESHRNEAQSLSVERNQLHQQVQEYSTRFEEQRLIEEGLNHQISDLSSSLKHFQEREAELTQSSSQTAESLNNQISMLSQDLEAKNTQISSYEAQLSDFAVTLESLRHENEDLNSRCSHLTLELESKSIESANLTAQLQNAMLSQEGNEEQEQQSAFAPPPDVTQYQQQPDVALHSIPQPDIMPSGYVDLVQQPVDPAQLYSEQQQLYDPNYPLQEQGVLQEDERVSSRFSQEVQTQLSHFNIDHLLSLEAHVEELNQKIDALQDTNAHLESSLSLEQKNHEDTLNSLREELSQKVAELDTLKNEKINAEAIAPSGVVDSATTTSEGGVVEDTRPSLEEQLQLESNMTSFTENAPPASTIEWYNEQLNTYQKAISDWQEWGRLKTEELEGYASAYNEASKEVQEARSSIDAKSLEIQEYTNSIQALSDEINQLRSENGAFHEAKASNDDSWRAKIRSKEIEIQDLTETVERLKSEKEELVEEVNELREKNESLRGDRVSSEELEDLKYQLYELSEEKRLNALEIESLKKQEASGLAKEENLVKLNNKLQGDVDLANSMIKKLESELKEAEEESKKKDNLAGETLLASQKTGHELRNEIEGLKSEIDSYKEEIKQLKYLLDMEKNEKSAFSNEKSNEIDSYNSEIASLKNELASVKGSLDTANTALAEWSSWGQTKMTEYDTLLKSYEEYVSAYNAINTEFSALKEGLSSSEENSNKIKENLDVLEEQEEEAENAKLVDDLKAQLSASLAESEKLKEEVQNVRLRNGKLTVRSKQMEKELAAIKKGGEVSHVPEVLESDELRTTNYELSKNVSSLQDELLESAKNMEELNNERISLCDKVTDLQNQIDHLNHENEVLRNVRSDYDNLKIKYDVLTSEKSFEGTTTSSQNDNLLIAQFETELQRKNDMLTQLESELSRLRLLGDTDRLELDKSLRENRQLSNQMNYWKQQIYTEQQQIASSPSGTSSPHNELHVARQAASAFQVQVEQLTTELTKLQEERDTLQLKLSNLMRQYERQRESSSRASTACSTPIPWMDPSLVEIKELKSKIEELGSLNYALDVELQKERQTREAMQARLRHQSSSSSSSTPVHLPHKPAPSDLSSLSGGHVLHL